MLGAIIGDVAGSRFEFSSHKTKHFIFLDHGCDATDDSVMTVAVGLTCAEADLEDEDAFKALLVSNMRRLGRQWPDAGYGSHFYHWIFDDTMGPYHSFGNGSAMRVSPTAWAATSLDQAEELAAWSAEVTHNHPEGIKGAQAVAACIYLAREGKSKEEIRAYVEKHYYSLAFTLDEIRPTYEFDVTCQGSVPEAIVAFLEAESFEDAVRNAISLGGDGDTQAAIAGSIAEAYFGIPDHLQEQVFHYLDEALADYYLEYAEVLYH